jgi:glucose/arabinose dehydrogenase
MDIIRTTILASLAVSPVLAQFSTTLDGCTLDKSNFVSTELFNKNGTSGAIGDNTLSEPTRMDVQVVRDGKSISHVNVFFVERLGKVKMYDGAQKKVVNLGSIAVWAKGTNNDNGLMGIALDPDFAQNRNVFFWYSPDQLRGQNRLLRLTRITLNADYTLNKATEKILIEILASKTDQWHSGGPMQFDSYGDLWIAIGNNSMDLNPSSCNVMSATDSSNSAEWGSSNTASMRGGFIRIHPDDKAPNGKYSIPRGNFGEYWADRFEQEGKTALAQEYRDPAKVLPEVYVKGERSNYSISVHPTKRWLAWGTVNYANAFDEFNITRHPVFTGFPYFHANNAKTCNNITMTTASPVNNSPMNSGVKQLPPAVPGALNNHVNVAIGGPIYAFDPALDLTDPSNDNKPVKFPMHFDNTWILSGFDANMLWVAKLDTSNNDLKVSGTPSRQNGNLLPNPRNHVQSMYGADGALYILNYDGHYMQARNPGVMRIIYTGSCGAPVSVDKPLARTGPYQRVWLAAGQLRVGEKGPHTVSLHALDGSLLHQERGMDAGEYSLREWRVRLGLQQGVYLVRARTAQGDFTRSVSLH